MKKLLATALALIMVLSMALCGAGAENALAGTYDITVWVSELDGVKELTLKQIDAFMAANPGIIINATVEGVGEGEAATQMVTSVEDGADIFCFAQDQLARLVMAGALNKLGQGTAATVSAENDAGSVAAASVGGQLYCFPLTSDNGYFMFYDKSVIPEADLGSMEAIIADCEAAGKMFSFELEGSAWYNAGFFFATGCTSEWNANLDGEFESVNDDFNSDKGMIAMKGMQKLLKSACYNNSSAHADFNAAIPSAVVVSGTWGTSIAQSILGENFGAAPLPSFEVDGQTYHIGSYSGNKLMGVKPQVDAVRAAVLQRLALYLSGEECQTQRFEAFGWGPSNLNAQANESVQQDVALSALAAQNAYAVPQGQIHGSWWDIAKVYATAARVAEMGDEAALQAALDTYTASINGLFAMSAEEKAAFSVIGNINGDGWSIDLPMTQVEPGVWVTDEAYALKAGNEFKCRQGKSWDVNYGVDGNNFVVAADGTYKIQLTVVGETGTIELLAQ